MKLSDRLRAHRADVLAAVVLGLLSLLVVGLHGDRYQVLGPFDEAQHVDYVYRLRDGELPRYGELITERTRQDLHCRGSDNAIELFPPECQAPLPSAVEAPAEGQAYEAGQPPAYYVAVAVVDAVVGAVDVGWGRVGVMRAVGALWLAVGAWALYGALRALRRGVGTALAAAAVAVAAPGVVFAAATVSNDIATWTVGSLALLAVVACARWWFPVRAWGRAAAALVALGVLGGLVKATTLLVLLLASGVLVALSLGSGLVGRDRWRSLVVAAAPVAAGGLTVLAWGLLVLARQVTPAAEILPFSAFQADGVPLDTVVLRFWNTIPPLLPQYLPPFLTQSVALSWALTASRIVQLGVLALPALARPAPLAGPGLLDRTDRAIGFGLLVATLATSPFYVAMFWITAGQDEASQLRFGLPLVPFLLVVATGWVPAGWRRWTVLAVLGLPSLVALWLLVTGGHPSIAG